MIMKIDHIGITLSRSEKRNMLGENDAVFEEQNLININSKRKLMKNWYDYHDIVFYRGTPFPIEYIFYDSIYEKTPNRFENGVLYGSYSNKDQIKKAINSQDWIKLTEEDDNSISGEIGGVLDHFKLPFHLVRDDNIKVYLDSGGVNNIALLCNKKYYDKSGIFKQTDYERLLVNGRNLDISFIFMDGLSFFVELISPGGKE